MRSQLAFYVIGLFSVILLVLEGLFFAVDQAGAAPQDKKELDKELALVLRQAGFTGRIKSTLEQRLGRPIDRKLAKIGRLLWFDTITGLNDDNSCAGCHSPTAGFGDTQSIAIGIENNGIVGQIAWGREICGVHR